MVRAWSGCGSTRLGPVRLGKQRGTWMVARAVRLPLTYGGMKCNGTERTDLVVQGQVRNRKGNTCEY